LKRTKRKILIERLFVRAGRIEAAEAEIEQGE
jgi:hypothetical protein